MFSGLLILYAGICNRYILSQYWTRTLGCITAAFLDPPYVRRSGGCPVIDTQYIDCPIHRSPGTWHPTTKGCSAEIMEQRRGWKKLVKNVSYCASVLDLLDCSSKMLIKTNVNCEALIVPNSEYLYEWIDLSESWLLHLPELSLFHHRETDHFHPLRQVPQCLAARLDYRLGCHYGAATGSLHHAAAAVTDRQTTSWLEYLVWVAVSVT